MTVIRGSGSKYFEILRTSLPDCSFFSLISVERIKEVPPVCVGGGLLSSIADAFPPMSELYPQRKMMIGGEVAVIKANEGGKEEGGLAIYIAVAAGVADRVQGNQVVLGTSQGMQYKDMGLEDVKEKFHPLATFPRGTLARAEGGALDLGLASNSLCQVPLVHV